MSNGVLNMISFGSIVMILVLVVSDRFMSRVIVSKILMIFFFLCLVSRCISVVVNMWCVVMIWRLKWWCFLKRCWLSRCVLLVIICWCIMCLV